MYVSGKSRRRMRYLRYAIHTVLVLWMYERASLSIVEIIILIAGIAVHGAVCALQGHMIAQDKFGTSAKIQ